jgi:hypothetical protein
MISVRTRLATKHGNIALGKYTQLSPHFGGHTCDPRETMGSLPSEIGIGKVSRAQLDIYDDTVNFTASDFLSAALANAQHVSYNSASKCTKSDGCSTMTACCLTMKLINRLHLWWIELEKISNIFENNDNPAATSSSSDGKRKAARSGRTFCWKLILRCTLIDGQIFGSHKSG